MRTCSGAESREARHAAGLWRDDDDPVLAGCPRPAGGRQAVLGRDDRRDGSPHVVPVDGLWVDDVLYYGGSPETFHVRTARANPHVTIHLPDPWNVVVVEGEVHRVGPSAEFAQHLADLANDKYAEYGIEFDANSYSDPFGLHHRRVLAWSSFPADATRFLFED
ncbi:MAG TPA: pyridoxamine 5'-phosphate oxidase family protein [Ilumatobacteraceae bacterium]|nr:pyridoxamine 5'-phosphate oxidase family protein [Ilumatobacteraceae bacterium]